MQIKDIEGAEEIMNKKAFKSNFSLQISKYSCVIFAKRYNIIIS